MNSLHRNEHLNVYPGLVRAWVYFGLCIHLMFFFLPALRFGNPLLVQDVENYDPILNPVLNKELKRTGGRVLITLGDQVIKPFLFS